MNYILNTFMQKCQANFFISTIILTQLRENVPSRKQSEFVENAIARALQEKRFRSVMYEIAGAWKSKDHNESVLTFIRSLRDSKRV